MFSPETTGLLGLFIVCFLSATILPLASEVVVVYFLKSTDNAALTIIAIASLGNCLGGITNYALGYFGNKLFKPKINTRALHIVQKYGFWSAFFSWLPFIGDPLLITLGFLKSNFLKTTIFMCFGKVLRYASLLLI